MASIIEGNSVLAIDVGSAVTRAIFFDVVESRYRFIALGEASSTAHAPFNDITEGIGEALAKLERITGRTFVDENDELLTSLQEDGSGVEAIVATFSAGAPLNVVIVGLLADVSLESARKLSESTYAQVIESISLNDPRKAEEQIDAILKAKPDLIIIAGGTDDGASDSLQKNIETVGLATYLIPKAQRPAIIFVGNQQKSEDVRRLLTPLSSSFFTAANICPSVDEEDLRPARSALARAFIDIRKRQIANVDDMNMWAGGRMLPSAFAADRTVRLLSKLYGKEQALLSVNLGASATTVSVGFANDLYSKVYPEFGIGIGLATLLEHTDVENVTRWMTIDASSKKINNYIYTKVLYPNSIPATEEDLQIEQALGRETLRIAMKYARGELPATLPALKSSLLPLFEVILAGGSIISNAPTLGQSLLILLDALQPVGVNTLILDRHNLLPALGAAAEINSILPVQVLESGAFTNLATVISPVSTARYGLGILKASLRRSDGSISTAELKQGGFEILPLPVGDVAELLIQPQRKTDIGRGVGKKISMKVAGSALGIVFDGRGRPLNLTSDEVRRQELIKKWLRTLGG